MITNCTAAVNNAGAGAGIDAAPATRLVKCDFVDCHSSIENSKWVTAVSGHHLEACTFLRCNPFNVASASRCRIVGSGVAVGDTTIGSGAYTNCLVTGVAAGWLFKDAELVNCTVVANRGQPLSGTRCRAWNTIFKDNYKHNVSGTIYDIAGHGTWYFTNCIYKTHPNWDAYHLNDTDCIYNTAKLFEDSTRQNYDPAHPYKLRTNSPAVNAGLAIPGMAALTDYSGAGRVNGDRIDIGCYECWLRPLGFVLSFR